MSETIQADEAARLTALEQEAVNKTLQPAIAELSRPDLQVLVRRLRELRDRARAIASQQRREMRGKSAPRGASPARDDVGTMAKEQVLGDAVKRISEELRRRALPPAGEQAASAPKPSGGPPVSSRSSKATTKPRSAQGMVAKSSKLATVRADPREVGRVSKSVRTAQARRDAKS